MPPDQGFLDPNVVLPPGPLRPPAAVAAANGQTEHAHDPMDAEETQLDSQTQLDDGGSQATPANTHLWGSLLPTRAGQPRLDMWKEQETYNVGRHLASHFQLKGPKISNKHCRITWKGRSPGGDANEVIVEDSSANGTFINGVRIGNGKAALLYQGNEISFGQSSGTDPQNDFRYLYRHYGADNAASGGVFEHYHLSSELGKGAFASVRRAIGVQDGETYAVKVINQRQWALQPNTRKMFQREMEILSQLQHVNIVRWYDTFSDPSTIFLVMEFVDGGDLLEMIIKSGTGLDEVMSRCITHNICSGVAFLHSKDVVHRDLKPENILMRTGPPMLAKIADFGLAKMVDSGTQLVTTCGTPIYLAPEVVLRDGNNGYTPAVDSWSIGVITYSMLTMAMPFNEEDETLDMRTRMMQRQIIWEALEDVSENGTAAFDFIQRLLQFDVTQRMSMAQALQHPWLNDPQLDVSNGWTPGMDSRGNGSGGSGGSGGRSTRMPGNFSSYRRANGESAYENLSFYQGNGDSVLGSRFANGIADGQPSLASDNSFEREKTVEASTPVTNPEPLDDAAEGSSRPVEATMTHALKIGDMTLNSPSKSVTMDATDTTPTKSKPKPQMQRQMGSDESVRLGNLIGPPIMEEASDSSVVAGSSGKNENGKRPAPEDSDVMMDERPSAGGRKTSKRARGSGDSVKKKAVDDTPRRTSARRAGVKA